MLQRCVCRDIEHLGSLESTQEARVALVRASSNSYTSLLSTLPACSISRYARWRMNYLFKMTAKFKHVHYLFLNVSH